MKLIGLMTTYEDMDWIHEALVSMKELDGGIVCEGAYQETIALGKPPRSQDGTHDTCKEWCDDEKFLFLEANEKSDVQQRNLVLQAIKDKWGTDDVVVMIIDGDEEYGVEQLKKLKEWAEWFCSQGKFLGGLVWSKVYVDNETWTLHAFPRLFRLTPDCRFVDSNLMYWPEKNFTITKSDKEEGRCKLLPVSLATRHHSYQRHKERFGWKRDGRIARRGDFSWEWSEELDRPARDNVIFYKDKS